MSTPSTDSPLQCTRTGAVAHLRFNRPAALNAVDIPMARAFLAAVRELAADESLRAVVMSGAGKGFMAGGDLATLSADPVQGAKDLIGPLHEALTILGQMDAPLIAQVHGVAAGAGLSLMLQADFVLAAEDTRFNLAYINLGTSCDVGASWALPRMVGLRKAMEIALLGDAFNARQAEQLGLVNRVVPAEQLETEVQALAQRLAQGPTRALGHMRRLMRASWDRTLSQQLDAEAEAFGQCARTDDFRAGLDAFFARKPAQFKGR